MLLSIIIAFLIAKHKKLSITPLFHSYWLLPIALVELIYIIFQGAVLFGYYGFLPYASLLKSASLYVLLFPIQHYKLYKPSLLGSGLIVVGTLMNKIVMHANDGLMPVYPTLSTWTGYFDASPMGVTDSIHCLGSAETNLKILTDYIDIGFSILSPGDLLVHSFTIIIVYYTIKQLNQEQFN